MSDVKPAKEQLSKWIDNEGQETILSVSLMRPKIAGDDQKWGIYVDNLKSEVRGKVDGGDLTEEHYNEFSGQIDAIDPNSDQSGGWLIFTDGTKCDLLQLKDTPYTHVSVAPSPYALPYLLDINQDGDAWLLQVDRDHPKLYRYNEAFRDYSDKLSFRTYADMSDTREPMATVDFHSNSKAQSNGRSGSVNFHALGVSTDDYEQVQLIDFLNELGQAVLDLIEGTQSPLILSGPPERVGHIKKLIDYHFLCEDHIDAAGDALSPENLKPQIDELLSRFSRPNTAADTNEFGEETNSGFSAHIRDGRIAAYMLPENSPIMISGDSDELLDVCDAKDHELAMKYNRQALSVLMQGGQVKLSTPGSLERGEYRLSLRY